MQTPKVSILVPIYNVERYLAECLDSLCAQTLRDIEVICIDDGSTDSSPGILARYAAADARIRVISKPNSGYGASMNRGLGEARGEYVGIVEPDDYPDLVMFQKLYQAAVKHDCDLVKCNYYEHFDGREEVRWNLHGIGYGRPFDPVDRPQVTCTAPAIWTGLYRRSFLESEGIRFRETPGASFQDAGFGLKTWFAARRCMLLRRPMLHYRMDNPASSSRTSDKAFVVCDELADAQAFLAARPARHAVFAPWLNVDKWGKYRWNYDRIEPSLHERFAARMFGEFLAARDAGELDLSLFDETSRAQVSQLLEEGAERFAARYPDGYPADWQVKSGAAPAPACGADPAPATAPAAVPDGPSPAVTVIVPVFNCEPYVGQCIGSLLSQTYGDFEAIVVDDASTDGSLAAARAAAAGDGRFSFIAGERNEGLSAVRNVALDRAHGEYVVFLDSDDYLVDDALAKLVSRARAQRLDDLYFSAQSFYDSLSLTETMNEDFSHRPDFEGVATGRELFVFFEEREQFFTQAALRMVRRQFLEDAGIRFEEGILHEDILFTFQTLVASQRSSFLNEPLYLRRLRSGSIVGSKWTIRNIHGHFVSMQGIKAWLYAHAGELDDAFLGAMGHRLGVWRELSAHAWLHDVREADREAYLAGLSGSDRVDFFNDVVGSGGAADRVRDEYLESITYRVGDALVAVPRVVRNRLRAASVLLAMRCGDNEDE